jgi:hypothetical protein
MIVKIKTSKKAKDSFKLEQLKAQKGRCPLTGRSVTMATGVIDHDHVTGRIRAILTNGVNRAEGIINGAMTKWAGMKTQTERVQFLRNLADYYEAKPLNYIYPTHKTDDEKRIAKNKKAVKAYKLKKVGNK